jgi:hypothetical protein
VKRTEPKKALPKMEFIFGSAKFRAFISAVPGAAETALVLPF